jgi:hypothetical protein
MSRAKELRTSPENNINMYELFSYFSPEKKSKYVELLLNLLKRTNNFDQHHSEVVERLVQEFDFPKEEINQYPKLQIVFFYRLLDTMFNMNDLKSFRKFCEYNERGLIKQNDLTTYKNFDMVLDSLSVAELVADAKEMEKQIRIIHESDEWLLVRPLTFESSKKYGKGTKWCTTQENNPDYFFKYSSKGVLIYALNKLTGYKVASFNSLDKNEPEFSFWNAKDNRIDSLQSELTDELRKIIADESTIKAKSNRALMSKEDRDKEEKSLGKSGGFRNNYQILVGTDVDEVVSTRKKRISSAIQRESVEETISQEEPQSEDYGYDVTEPISENISETPTHRSGAMTWESEIRTTETE